MGEKYQQEIEEILKNAGEDIPAAEAGPAEKPLEDRPRSQQRLSQPEPAPRYIPRGRWPAITPGKMLLAGLVVFIVTALLQVWVLMWIGLGMLIVGYLLFFITPRSVSMDKRWRGRAVEDEQNSPWDRIKRWISS